MPQSAARAAAAGVLDALLARRILFVAGKGGSGKTSIAAALLLLAARRGMRVLGIEVDAKGDLCAALGAPPVGFPPQLVQSRISVLALHPEDSLREYLRVFFKVPRVVSLTPLSRIFDFVATSVPGPKDMLTVGKIAYEERRTTGAGRPMWDLIVVDCAATGHALAQIMAAREMRKITRGGMIRTQLGWVDAVLEDSTKTALVITALAEEMAVEEALDLHRQALAAHHVAVAACVVNRVPPGVTPRQSSLLQSLSGDAHATAVDGHIGGSVAALAAGVTIAESIHAGAVPQLKRLRDELSVPVAQVPLQGARAGLAMSRAVAAALEESRRE